MTGPDDTGQVDPQAYEWVNQSICAWGSIWNVVLIVVNFQNRIRKERKFTKH